jgi:hypothetical protein
VTTIPVAVAPLAIKDADRDNHLRHEFGRAIPQPMIVLKGKVWANDH